jgi:ferredoxin
MANTVTTQRKKKPAAIAVITDCCTGCAGSPVCQPLCPVDECMILIEDQAHGPFGYIWVDPLKCIGCKKCTTQGPDEILLDGCPWDAIEMWPLQKFENDKGTLPY